jgi:hypothetical protein
LAIDIDLSHWPLVFTRFEGSQTVEEVDAHFAQMESVHARKQPWVNISLMSGYTRDPRVMRRVAQGMKRTQEAIRAHCLAVAMVAPSAGFRFMLSSVLLIQPMSCPYAVCASLDEAWGFVRDKAAERKLILPATRPALG